MLTGLIFDDRGNSMSPKTARKPGNKAYTYYVSQAQIQQRETDRKPMRPLAAEVIEGLVRYRLLGSLNALGIVKEDPYPEATLCLLVRRYVTRIEVSEERTAIQFDAGSLLEDSKLSNGEVLDRLMLIVMDNESFNLSDGILHLTIEGALARRGGDKSLTGWDTNNWTAPRRKIDPSLVKALTRAHLWRDMVESGQVTTIDELARTASTERTHLARMLRLAFLAPDIQQAILTGRQPQSLRLRALLETELPATWSGQRQVLGFA